MRNKVVAIGMLLLYSLGYCTHAQAAVTAEEAKQLGTGTLTPWGAEKAGNKEGTIPEWTGQVTIPASHDLKKPGVRPDPFADEKPLYSINAQNAAKYGDKLSDGLKVMLKKYPTFRIDVYPTHRTATYPKYVVENTLKNATACKTTNGGNSIEGCYGGFPFPIPKTGAEVMWNHNLTYKSANWGGIFMNWYVDATGMVQLQSKIDSYQEQLFFDPNIPGARTASQIYWRYRGDIIGPARKVGNSLLIQDPVDQVNVGRRAWQYVPGQRRVKLAPDLAYDTPTPESGGAQNMDDAEVFNGALDRFDWKLLGKREMFIPYNTFKFADGKACSNSVKFTKSHINPDCVRWELHRVFVVEGKVKAGIRHIYPRRVFYWDEDAPGSGMGDNYDASGAIYRVSYNFGYPMYELQGWMPDANVTNDVDTGIYAVSLDAAENGGWYARPKRQATYFTPDDMAASGIR